MHKTFCDFCNKEIEELVVTATLTEEVHYWGSLDNEYHFHRECATRLINKCKQFAQEKAGEE